MKLIREHINEKFEEDSDPITNMGIGMAHYFKQNFLKLFAKEDKDYMFFSFTIYNGKIYFWGYSHRIQYSFSNVKDEKRIFIVFNHLKKIIKKLGFDNILYKPTVYFIPRNYSEDGNPESYLIVYEMHNAIKNVFQDGNYRKFVTSDGSSDFSFYEKPDRDFFTNLSRYSNAKIKINEK